MSAAGMLSGVRVLVAHRDGPTRDALRALLARVDADAGEAATADEAVELVRAERPDVLLLEAALCRRDRRAVLAEIAGDPDLLGTAVVLLQPDAGLDEIVAAIDSGAVDVWTSPRAEPALVARVRAAHHSRLLRDYALRRHEDLEELAYRDELTGLPNRRGALRRIEVILSRARRHDHPVWLLLIDADHFKSINDRWGHAAGDEVLRVLAARLAERVRGEDVIGRWGGEEVVVALSDTAEDGARAAAEGLREAVGSRPVALPGGDVPLTVSVGVAAWDGESLEALVERADRALYAAKAAGRDRVAVDARPAHAA
jgi:two-component system cell cycle response regulator